MTMPSQVEIPQQTITTNAPNQQIATIEGKKGFGKWIAAFASTTATTYIINQASLHGVDFKLYGIDSEFIKSAIDASIITGAVAAMPTHCVAALKDLILWCRRSVRDIRLSFTQPLQ